MAKQERERTYDEQQLKRKEIDQVLSDLSSEDKNQILSRFSRRTFLVRSGQLGLIAGGAAAVAGGIGGGLVGKVIGVNEVRGQFLQKGDLTPELREIFKNKNIFVYEPPKDETVASIRAYLSSIAAGFDIPTSPLAIPEGKPGSDTVVSPFKWLAIDPGNPFLGEGNEGVTALLSLVSKETTSVQTLFGRSDIQVASSTLRPIDIIGPELAYRSRTEGQSLFGQISQEGGYIIIPGAKVGNGGGALGVSESGFRWNVYDASSQNAAPPPYKLVAARVIVAK